MFSYQYRGKKNLPNNVAKSQKKNLLAVSLVRLLVGLNISDISSFYYDHGKMGSEVFEISTITILFLHS